MSILNPPRLVTGSNPLRAALLSLSVGWSLVGCGLTVNDDSDAGGTVGSGATGSGNAGGVPGGDGGGAGGQGSGGSGGGSGRPGAGGGSGSVGTGGDTGMPLTPPGHYELRLDELTETDTSNGEVRTIATHDRLLATFALGAPDEFEALFMTPYDIPRPNVATADTAALTVGNFAPDWQKLHLPRNVDGALTGLFEATGERRLDFYSEPYHLFGKGRVILDETPPILRFGNAMDLWPWSTFEVALSEPVARTVFGDLEVSIVTSESSSPIASSSIHATPETPSGSFDVVTRGSFTLPDAISWAEARGAQLRVAHPTFADLAGNATTPFRVSAALRTFPGPSTGFEFDGSATDKPECESNGCTVVGCDAQLRFDALLDTNGGSTLEIRYRTQGNFSGFEGSSANPFARITRRSGESAAGDFDTLPYDPTWKVLEVAVPAGESGEVRLELGGGCNGGLYDVYPTGEVIVDYARLK